MLLRFVCDDFAGRFPCFTSVGHGLCPFVPDVVEVRTVSGQVFRNVPCRFDQGFVSPRLWTVARPVTGTASEGSPGIRSGSGQRLGMSASALASVNPTHNKTPARTAPMTLTRPLAFRSCCPGQRCPRGAYPWVRAMSWAKPLPSIWTMGRASRSWASLLSPKPLPRRPGLLSGASGLFFICHARFAKRLPYGLRCHIKPRSALLSAGVGMVSHLLRKLLQVDLSDLPTLVGPGINPPGPTPDRGNSNREPLRGFSSAQAFLLPYRQNMPTKGYRICHHKQYHTNVAKL